MTTMVISSAILERLRCLSPEANPRSELIAEINNDLVFLLAHLKQSIEDVDANDNIAGHEKAKNLGRAILKLSYDFEDSIESSALKVKSRREKLLCRIFRRPSRQIKVMQNFQEALAVMKSQLPKTSNSFLLQALPVRCAGRRPPAPAPLEVDEGELDLDLTGIQTSELCVLVILREGGINCKSTLARKLLQNPQTQKHFNLRASVCVSKRYKMSAVLQEIHSSISETWVHHGRHGVDMPEEELAEHISTSLKGRPYLIVLDDIRSADAWFSLRMIFPDDNNGSRILITTRKRELAAQIGISDSHIYTLQPVSADISWKMLRHKLLLDGTEVSSEMEQTGKEIARWSKGLPLAIDVLAGTLLYRPLHEWKLVLQHLGDASSDQIYDVLSSSYKNLPLQLRPCLLYLGNFPEDAEIEMEAICQLWIAEGLISMVDRRNGETMMDVAARYFDELDNRCLFQIPEEELSVQRKFKSRRIHDLIRHFCKTKGEDDEFFQVIDSGDKNQILSSSVRCAIYLDKYECTYSYLYGNAYNLRSILFFNSSQSGEGIIRPQQIPNLYRFIWLRVLYFHGIDFEQGKLPKGAEKLVYLRFLSFRECYLKELSSSISNMLYLQTLDLRIRNECQMIISAHVLDNLERLKYLYLPMAYRTHDNNEKLHLGRLKELEILDNFDTSQCNAEELMKLTNLKELTVNTEGDVSKIKGILDFVKLNSSHLHSTSLNIRRFDCQSKKRFSVMEEVFKSRALYTLGVEGYLGKLPEFDRISSKLTEIVLNGSELVEDPMQILQELPNLRILVLEIEAYVGKKMQCSSSGFPELRYLKLVKLYNLEVWEVEKEAMPKLCTLVIENCKKLEMLPVGLQFIANLRKLEITSMPDEFVGKIQKSDGSKGDDFYKIDHVHPNLKVDGQPLTLREGEQEGHREDPNCSSMF